MVKRNGIFKYLPTYTHTLIHTINIHNIKTWIQISKGEIKKGTVELKTQNKRNPQKRLKKRNKYTQKRKRDPWHIHRSVIK